MDGCKESGGKDSSGEESYEKWSRKKTLALALELLPIDVGFKMCLLGGSSSALRLRFNVQEGGGKQLIDFFVRGDQ